MKHKDLSRDSLLRSAAEFARRSVASIVTLGRVAYEFRGASVQAKAPNDGALIILGGGPSLKDAKRYLSDGLPPRVDTVSVNDGFRDETFAICRPIAHILADPLYWDDACFERLAQPLLEAVEAADWRPTVYLPVRGRGSRLAQSGISRGLNIRFFRMVPLAGFDWLVHRLFMCRLGMPKVQNVMVGAIGIGMWLGYRQIALLGADHSWHEEIQVTHDNVVVTVRRHSYSAGARAEPFLKPLGHGHRERGMDVPSSARFTMEELFAAWSAAFGSYMALERIARSESVQILNCSTHSFIDAFERRELAGFIDMIRGKTDLQPAVSGGS